METSPPGPRVRVLDAVAAALATEGEGRAQSLVIAGNYGRAKTSQLRSVYASHARLVSRDATPLPLYLQANTFPLDDDLPEQLLARGIEATYAKFGVVLTASDVIRRLGQPCLLCVDGDDGADGRRRSRPSRASARSRRPARRPRRSSPSTSSSWRRFARSIRRSRSWWCS